MQKCLKFCFFEYKLIYTDPNQWKEYLFKILAFIKLDLLIVIDIFSKHHKDVMKNFQTLFT